ncbi:MAG: cytochrome C biogenesis protein [Planctomycetota bacterium]|nr:MAG: cytochrome C biogenesis protein [Planctomycetota bacterium]
MIEYLQPLLLAMWWGLLTAISPCPLTTNIAAISFLSREAGSPGRTAWAGLAYTLGRVVAYVGIAALITASLLRSHSVSRFLQQNMQPFVGPLLLMTGVILLDLLPFSFGAGVSVSEGFGKRVRALGLLGAFALGLLFALAFCPVSAALFFMQLIPLAVAEGSVLLLPSLYGVGTALPIVAFVLVIAFSSEQLGKRFTQAQALARWSKLGTGVLLLAIGLYMLFAHTFFG